MKRHLILLILIQLSGAWAQGFEVLSLQPFSLKIAKPHLWELEKPTYTEGSLIIAKVNPNEFAISQGHNNQVFVEGRILERLDSGENRSVLAFFLPEKLHNRSIELLVKKTTDLPEQISKKQRQDFIDQARISQQLRQVSISAATEKTFKNGTELYDWAGHELLKLDPSAKTYIEHWFIKK